MTSSRRPACFLEEVALLRLELYSVAHIAHRNPGYIVTAKSGTAFPSLDLEQKHGDEWLGSGRVPGQFQEDVEQPLPHHLVSDSGDRVSSFYRAGR